MATATDIITNAFIKCGVYAPGETIAANDLTFALEDLNDMLDSWSLERLFTFANTETSFALVPGQQQYTIGAGAQINAPRPAKINTGPGAAYLMDAQGDIYGVDVVTQDAWNQIGYRQSTSNLPDTLFYDPQFPNGIINIFPIPSQTITLYFDSWLPLTSFPDLVTNVSLPPGYKDAMQFQMTVRLGTSYKADGWQPSPLLLLSASRAIAAVKRTNIKLIPAVYESALVSKAASTYNIYRGY